MSRDYLPPGLPHNIGEWPEKYREMNWLDLRANQLINQLIDGKISRLNVEHELETVDEKYSEHFKARLNHWREYHNQKRGKTK
ncbi:MULTISPECIES: hypothetical protein [Brenneria]|uniref:Uncharacterized protein n=1 Tax=Brenneria nigrifluens DSM 30175 = ATCC 13028 TaxID=1121120 RepID=A0A2U1UUX7_9GAMM|nr:MULTISPECIES: hypothetical protein [Brenneria]EHD22092.1 hypothetical protein BrE312_2716 [Brenneria sp. EniD312]PWC25422.1 hypothetical protein DDT54_05870 [Brenneria nigrifluens DSM 30175 = ATCC 13028]QCR05172.1 hypothetical protein EH206_13825 [Brenneria nigrifluens DSM 30175 = ATCC 13028]